MRNTIDLSKHYWFYLSSDTYVSYGLGTAMLLYHTKTGARLERDNASCMQLVKEVYSPQNLGVIELSSAYREDKESASFIQSVIKEKMGGLIEVDKERGKPINLLPILSLQKDIEKLEKSGDISLAISNLMGYLSELNIYLNSSCNDNCAFCNNYYKQVKSCLREEENKELSLETLTVILNQIEYSSVKKINISGGDLSQYSESANLGEIIKQYDYEFHFWVNSKHLSSFGQFAFEVSNIYAEILFTFPIKEEEVKRISEMFQNALKNTYYFLVESEEQYVKASEITEKLDLGDYVSILPIFTGENIAFFENNVYLNIEDVFDTVISMRKIFCNQKLNSNSFGALTILPNGDVKANINTKRLGNIYNSSILELIYIELTQNTAWRKTRNQGACCNCLYRFLCPPPSNYETAIGRLNLCNINSEIGIS